MRKWHWLVLLSIGGFVFYGVWAYTRLPDRSGSIMDTYGAPGKEAEDPVRIEEAVAHAKGRSAPTLAVQGNVVDMGPTMGCWLLLRDGTGEVLVQTVPMVYMPQRLRGATVKAMGRLVYGRLRGMGYDREGWFLLSPGVEVVNKRS